MLYGTATGSLCTVLLTHRQQLTFTTIIGLEAEEPENTAYLSQLYTLDKEMKFLTVLAEV